MSYKPVTHAEIIANLIEAELTAAGKTVGLARLVAAKGLKVVDSFDLRLANEEGDDKKYGLARLAHAGIADPSEWTVLAVSHRDESYFDTVDGKWDYCYTDYAVVAPTDLVAEIVADTFVTPPEWVQAVKAGYGEYA